MLSYEMSDIDTAAFVERIIRSSDIPSGHADRIRRAASDPNKTLYVCEACHERLAVLAVDRTISQLGYDAEGDLVEEPVDGDAIAMLCRPCAGRDARYVPLAPWER